MQDLESSDVLLTLFFVMHTFGWIGSAILLLVAILSPKVHRHGTWINLCLSWIIACFGFAFLLTSGQLTRPTPTPAVCLFQAASIYSGPPLTAGATLSLAIHLWLTICSNTDYSKVVPLRRNIVKDILLVLWPYFGAVSIFIGVFTVGLQRKDKVVLAPSRMYCGLDDPIPGKVSAIYVAVLTGITMIIEAHALLRLYRNFRLSNSRNGKELAIMYRLIAFSVFGVFALSISLTYLSGRSYGRLPNVLMAITPVSFVVIFGSQMDIIRAFTFWRPAPAPLNGLKPSKPIGVNTSTDVTLVNGSSQFEIDVESFQRKPPSQP